MFKYKTDGVIDAAYKAFMTVPTEFSEPVIKEEEPKDDTDSQVPSENSETQASYKPDIPSDNITERKNEAEKDYLNWKQSQKPKYDSKYQSSVESLLKELSEREFSYDISKDEVYRRYRDSVRSSAELALADAVGLTSALNGGYSTSYAQLAGQAAYYNVMKEADSMIPQFYNDAYERYSDETDNIEDRLDYLLEMDEAQWDRYLDMLDEYNSEGESLFERFRELSDEEFDRFYSIYKLSF